MTNRHCVKADERHGRPLLLMVKAAHSTTRPMQ